MTNYSAAHLLTTLLLSFFAWPSLAQVKLPFPADLNQLQPLAQRFVYDMSSPSQFQIGDLSIDPQQLSFSLHRSDKGHHFRFRWPPGLFASGKISVLSSQGKAIWSASTNSSGRSTPTKSSAASSSSLFQSGVISEPLLSSMMNSSFVTFCISSIDPETKIYLCTREISVSKGPSGYVLSNRNQGPQIPFVELNGKRVAPQGVVYLNSDDDDLLMRAQLKTGETIELMTRRKATRFVDVVESPEPGFLKLTTEGAAPALSEKFTKMSDTTYVIQIPADRPVYYVQGTGGIPLRQEFLLKGPVPNEKDRLSVTEGFQDRTYSSKLTFTGPLSSGVVVGNHGSKSQVQTTRDTYTWHLLDLAPGINERTISIQKDQRTYIAGARLEKGRANEIRGHLKASASSIAQAELQYRRWLNGLHWGAELSTFQYLNENEDHPKQAGYLLGFSYRFQAQFAETLEGSGLRLFYGQIQARDFSVTSPAIEAFYQRPWLTPWTSAVEAQGRIWTGGGGADVKLKTSWAAEAAVLRRLWTSTHLRAEIEAAQWAFEPSLPKNNIDLSVTFGLITFF